MAIDTGQESLQERAMSRVADIDLVGVAAVEDTRGTPLFESATGLLAGAQSIVVLGIEIFAEVAGLVVPEKEMGEAAARDLYGPHIDYLNGRLNRAIYEMAKIYRQAGYKAIPLPSLGTPTDTRFQKGILSFKHAAQFAGLGKIGHSSLLITPQFGPRVRLAAMLTDAPIPSTRSAYQGEEDPCAACGGLCEASCPAGALSVPTGDAPYAINKFACGAYRQGTGCCSTCLIVCPAGEK
ncbi:MAG: 4Fe-4S binding protein [Chloroflexota bacterium]